MPANPHPLDAAARDKLRVLIMSQREAESYRPNANEACISITSPGQPWANLSSRFRAVLRLAFHDLAGFQREDGSYPDGAVQLSKDEAERIAAFVYAYRDAERIVVHCQAGVSRSVAVGLAISTHLSRYWAWPSYMPVEYRRARYVHNRAVFDLVAAALKAMEAPNAAR